MFASYSTLCSILSLRASLFQSSCRSLDHSFLFSFSLLLGLSISPLCPSFPCNLPQCVTGPRATESRSARAAMFTRFWWRFFVRHNAFLSVHVAILIMLAAGRVTTCARWFLVNCVLCVGEVSFCSFFDWTRRACAYVGSSTRLRARCENEND